MKTIQFISGLPRSGSTLLASILRQNPDFQASIMSPVGRIFSAAMQAMSTNDNEAVTDTLMRNDQRVGVLQGLVYGYYAADASKVIFDTNRRWTANVGVIKHVFPDAKVICCLRDPAAIVDSFERLFQAHPLNLSVIIGAQANTTIYERVSHMMQPTGVVGFALNAFRTAFFGPHRKLLHLVSYDDLCRYPAQVMDEIHLMLDMAPFKYNFEKIEPIPGAAEFDQKVQTPGLHDLHPSVIYPPRQTVLPPDIFNNLPTAFWQPVKEAATVTG